MDDEPKTFFKVRITKSTREVWTLGKFLFYVSLPLIFVGSCQTYICKDKNPKKEILECLAPLRYKK